MRPLRKFFLVSLPAIALALVVMGLAVEGWVRATWEPRKGVPGFFLSDAVRGIRLNPGYSGWCRQTVPIRAGATPKQTCQAVLSCLNGNACESNYCNAGNIRSGWRLEEAKPSAPPR